MPARRHEDGAVGPLGLPRNLLVPYVLLFLKNWSAHGYQILQTLTLLGFAARAAAAKLTKFGAVSPRYIVFGQ